jgi:hypothetical protein
MELVTFSEAKQEFAIRYYLWASSDFEREINASFPNFHSFKTGAVWELYQFMQQLSKSDQMTLARSLLKRFHPEAVKALDESCSVEEESLRWRRDNFFLLRRSYQGIQQFEKSNQPAAAQATFNFIRLDALKLLGEPYLNDERSLRSRFDALFSPIPSSMEEQIAARKLAGEKIKFMSKRKLLKLMAAKFQNAFAGECVELERVLVGDPALRFEMKCGGWMLNTNFWFGRGESLINYCHTISSKAALEHQGPAGKYMAPLVIGFLISFTAWLGITSQMEWEYLTEENAESACDAAIKLCRHFFEIAPKLLRGLEPEKITGS